MNDRFGLVFFAVIGLTAFCGLSALFLAIWMPASPPALLERLFNAHLETFTLGVGSIITLLSSSRPKGK